MKLIMFVSVGAKLLLISAFANFFSKKFVFTETFLPFLPFSVVKTATIITDGGGSDY